MRKSLLIANAGVLYVCLLLASFLAPAYASQVAAATISSDRASYGSGDQVGLTVRIAYDTSGMIGMGTICLVYKITIKEKIAYWPDKKLFEQQYRSDECFSGVGRLPQYVSLAQSIALSASQLGEGRHSLYAIVAVSAAQAFGVPTSWDTGSSFDIPIRVG